MTRRGLAHLAVLLALALLALVPYVRTFDVPFVFDDLPNIANNPAVQPERLDPGSLRRAATDSPLPARPLAYVSFAVDHVLGGGSVTAYHAMNLAVHVLAGWAVYAVGLLVLPAAGPGGRPRAAVLLAAAAAAAIFVAHPLQTQAVTYVVQRMTSMAAMFYLFAFALYLLGRRAAATWRRAGLWLAALAAWLLALATKEIAITLPLAIVLYEWLFHPRPRRAAQWAALAAPLLLLVAGAAALVLLRDGDLLATIRDGYRVFPFTLGERLLTETRVVVFYASLVLWPAPSRLSLLHDIEISRTLLDPVSTLAAAALLAASVAGALLAARRAPLAAFAVLWFLLQLALESSVLPLELAFEHRLYLPLAGPALLAGSLLAGPARPPGTRAWPRLLAIAALVAALGAATAVRNEVWRDPVALWSDVAAKNPGNAAARNNLATALLARGELARAEDQLRAALAITPGDARLRSNLGVVLARTGRNQEAASHLYTALRLHPRLAEAHHALAGVLAALGQYEQARLHYQLAATLQADAASRPAGASR